MKTVTWTWTGVSRRRVAPGARGAARRSLLEELAASPSADGRRRVHHQSRRVPGARTATTRAESCTLPTPACPTTRLHAGSPCLAMADNTGSLGRRPAPPQAERHGPAGARRALHPGRRHRPGDQPQRLLRRRRRRQLQLAHRVRHDEQQASRPAARPRRTTRSATGYCFVNATIGGLPVAPVTVNMTKGADGSWPRT